MKNLKNKSLKLNDEVLAKGFAILFDDFKKHMNIKSKSIEIKSILTGGTKPCVEFEKWNNFIKYLENECETPADKFLKLGVKVPIYQSLQPSTTKWSLLDRCLIESEKQNGDILFKNNGDVISTFDYTIQINFLSYSSIDIEKINKSKGIIVSSDKEQGIFRFAYSPN